jgi:hypothetical protein
MIDERNICMTSTKTAAFELQFPPHSRSRDRQLALLGAMAITAALGLGCGSGDSGGAGGSSGTGGAGGQGGAGSSVDAGNTADVALGAFVVTLKAASTANGDPVPAFSTVSGSVYDGQDPEMTIWKVEEEASGCKLLTPKQPFCNPACGAQVCVEGGKCVPHPTRLDVGLVHVKGLGSSEFDMESIGGSYSAPGSVTLPYPPAPEGALVQMSAPGGTLGAIALSTKAIAPLVVPAGNLHPVSGQPLALTWSAPGHADIARIEIKVDLSHHGGIKGKIECNVADTGSLQIPASQITKLLGLGISGYPTVSIDRVSAGSTSTPRGQVQLKMSSAVEHELQIDGLTSCTKDEDCPTGKTCAVDLKCS